MAGVELELSVTEFKAKCLELFSQIASGEVAQILLTKHGKAIAQVRPPSAGSSRLRIYGSMRGRAVLPPDLDLTDPSGEGLMVAEQGILYFDEAGRGIGIDGAIVGHMRADLDSKGRSHSGRGARGGRTGRK